MRNKANLPIADCRLPERHRATGIRLRRSCRIADWGQTSAGGGRLCKTNPICSHGKGSVGQAPPYRWTLLRQTNPIRPAPPSGATCAKRTQFPAAPGGPWPRGVGRGANVQNEANFVNRDEANVQNEPNLPGGAGRRSLAPPPSGPTPAKPIVQNEPNFRPCRAGRGHRGRGARGNRAKRTQFARWGRAGRGPGGGGRGANAQNEPNLARAGPGRDGRKTQNEPNFRPVGPDPEGRLCKTKPICPPRPGGLPSPLPNRLCKTKPNLGRMGYLGGASGRHIMRNEANLSPGRCRAGACPEFVEGTPNPRSGRGQAPRGAEVSVGAPAPSMHEPAFGYNGRHWRNKGASERRWPWLLRRKS